jgi:hypothetical protein
VRLSRWIVLGLVLVPSLQAGTLRGNPGRGAWVDCSSGQTIGRALARLDPGRPSVLRVSGTCREAVEVRGFDDLRIVAAPGAALESVPGDSAYPLAVYASRSVSIEGLTVRVTDISWKPAFFFWTCGQCSLTDVTVEGGTTFWAFSWSQVSALRLHHSGAGGGGPVLANAKLDMEESSFDGGGSGGCGLSAAENAVAVVKASTFRRFSSGVCAASGGQVHFWNGNVVEDNSCSGIQVRNGGHAEVHQSTVRGNGGACLGGGISVDLASRLFVDSTEVRSNSGGGILVDHQSFAGLGAGAVVSGNADGGLRLKNGSRAVGPVNPTQTAEVSGSTGGADLACDSTSHVNNAARITGVTSTSCPNVHAGDGP